MVHAQQDKAAIDKLYSAAKKEGRVVIWGPTDGIVYEKMQELLDKQYPGIKIEHFESIPEPLVQRIIAENQAGKPAAVDIIQSGSLRALRPLIDRDLLASYPGWEKDFGLDAVYANHRFVGAYNLALPISYNSKAVSAKDAPKSWEELAEPKWKGKKIIIEARLVPFAMLGTEWGKEKAMALVNKILGQQPIIVQGGTTVANALAGGQVSIAVGTYAFTIEGLKKRGASVDWIAPSPLPVLTSAEGVLKTASHPNAARFLLVGWAPPRRRRFDTRFEDNPWKSAEMPSATWPNGSGARNRRSSWKPKRLLPGILEIQREMGKLLGALR